jgi:hypothetical protein
MDHPCYYFWSFIKKETPAISKGTHKSIAKDIRRTLGDYLLIELKIDERKKIHTGIIHLLQ